MASRVEHPAIKSLYENLAKKGYRVTFVPVDGAGRPIEEEKDGNYCRFLFRDGKLIGAVLLGDISASGAVRKAVEGGENLSALLRTKPSGSQVLEYLRSLG